MKKRDYLLFVITTLCIFLSTIIIYLLPQKENTQLIIKVENSIYGTYSLDENQTISINDTNICVIEDGIVYMSHANCPDLVCVHSKAIDKHGGIIVCLPNRITLEIHSKESKVDTLT